jgi:hypothetical protein
MPSDRRKDGWIMSDERNDHDMDTYPEGLPDEEKPERFEEPATHERGDVDQDLDEGADHPAEADGE